MNEDALKPLGRNPVPSARALQWWLDHKDRFLRFIAKWLPNDADAEDILQEVGVVFFMEAADKVEEDGFEPFLFRVARNKTFDHLRRRGNQPSRHLSLDGKGELLLVISREPSAEQQASDESLLEALRSRLSEEEYQILIMKAEDATFKQIGERLGYSESYAKVLWIRLQKRLQSFSFIQRLRGRKPQT